jgi:cysteine desulfurase
MARLRDRFEAGLQASSPDVVIFGAQAPRLPNTCLFTVPGLKAETAVIAFDLAGVAVSSGSACSSGRVQASHVLTSMGVEPGQARGAVRVSLGWTTTEADIDRLLAAWIGVGSSLLKQHAA